MCSVKSKEFYELSQKFMKHHQFAVMIDVNFRSEKTECKRLCQALMSWRERVRWA
jgi:hypothetical protein